MLIETQIVPYKSAFPPGERVLVLAPHPDDETFGMGGSLKLLTGAGKKVRVVVLTSGEKARAGTNDNKAYSYKREQEAVEALAVLGVEEYEFLRFPDRGLHAHRDAVERAIDARVAQFAPDAIYSPSLVELHPDHRIVAELALELSLSAKPMRCIYYEITVPVRPNIFIDISGTFSWKRKAMGCYASQSELIDYAGIVEALNRYRTFTLGKGVAFAEAFWELQDARGRQDISMWLNYETPFVANNTHRM